MSQLPLYTLPSVLRPNAAIFVAPSNTQDGFLSRGGYENNIAVAGSRGQMHLEFAPMQFDDGRLYSWALNNLKRARWLVPVYNTPQLATSAQIQAIQNQYPRGIPFSDGRFFSTGYGFEYIPTLPVVSRGLEGDTTLIINDSEYPNVLDIGHVIGAGRTVQHIDAIERDGTKIQVTFNPPLRRTITAGERVSLRPSMVCKPQSVDSFLALFSPAQIVIPGPIIMDEVIDEAYL